MYSLLASFGRRTGLPPFLAAFRMRIQTWRRIFSPSAQFSGGSLGAAVFDALLAEPNPDSFKFKDKAHDILSQDFLYPTLASMLYPDLVQRFIPCPIPFFDRARALEMGWEKAWRDTMGNNRFANSIDQRNLTSASVVSFGRSSSNQCPVSFNTTTSTLEATSFICAASSLPNDFSPPIDSTGIVNFVCDSCAKSLASCGHEAK